MNGKILMLYRRVWICVCVCVWGAGEWDQTPLDVWMWQAGTSWIWGAHLDAYVYAVVISVCRPHSSDARFLNCISILCFGFCRFVQTHRETHPAPVLFQIGPVCVGSQIHNGHTVRGAYPATTMVYIHTFTVVNVFNIDDEERWRWGGGGSAG